MFKKIAIILLFLAAIINTNTAKASTSSIMLDAETGAVMYENNPDEVRYPASLTKLMTLYITFNALEHNHIKLSDKLKISKTAAGRSPSKLGVVAGQTISVKDAINAVIVKSANDCATVLAEHFSKNEAEFAILMTSTARRLGMKNTTFKNASGLPNSKQKTTARDMATLAMAVYHHFPQYYKLFSAQSFVYKGQTIKGHNNILKTFAGADGMKTGYTAASGFNIITSATRGNKRVIAVTMGHKFVNERDKKVALIMDKGLDYINKNEKIDVASLTNLIENKAPVTQIASAPKATANASVKTKTMANASATSKVSAEKYAIATSGNYAVQVGSFSNYQRAKNYALTIKNKIAKQYAVHDVKIETINANNGTLYRSKVVGLAKNDARKICQNMKRNKQACIVVANIEKQMKLAQR